MKIIGFKLLPAIAIFFADEGDVYYEIAEDQDADLLELARQAGGHCDLPEHLEVCWAGDSTVAVRREGEPGFGSRTVLGEFNGVGAVIEATVRLGEVTSHLHITNEPNEETAKQLLEALNALLTPVRIVADISGGALHGTYADRPAVVLYKSDDPDDVMDFEATHGEHSLLKSMGDGHVAHWVKEAELFSDIVDHYHEQVRPC